MSLVNLNKIITNYISCPLNDDTSYFTQFSIDKDKLLPESLLKDYFIDGNSYCLKIISANILSTLKGTSIEGQHLTGKKLSITGIFLLKIIFTHKKCGCKSYILKTPIPFSTFIIVPEKICDKENINLGYNVEDINIVPLCSNKIFISIMLLLQYEDFLS